MIPDPFPSGKGLPPPPRPPCPLHVRAAPPVSQGARSPQRAGGSSQRSGGFPGMLSCRMSQQQPRAELGHAPGWSREPLSPRQRAPDTPAHVPIHARTHPATHVAASGAAPPLQPGSIPKPWMCGGCSEGSGSARQPLGSSRWQSLKGRKQVGRTGGTSGCQNPSAPPIPTGRKGLLVVGLGCSGERRGGTARRGWEQTP